MPSDVTKRDGVGRGLPSLQTLTTTEPADGLLLVTIDREPSANTVSAQVSNDLLALTSAIDATSMVSAVVITGRGERFFCAGADLRDPTGGTPEWLGLARRALDALADLRVPTVAAVNGLAYGGGVEIALACDIRIAADHATFSLPEIKIGALPGAGGLTRLQHLVGPSISRRLVFTGCKLDAAEALRIGLVDEVVPTGESVDASVAIGAELADYAPYALTAAKKIFKRSLGAPIDEALTYEYDTVDKMATPEQMREQRVRAAQRDPAYAKVFRDPT